MPSPVTSPATLPFHLVDVFALEPFTGNPLAVVEGGGDLPRATLQRIAREFNQSETTFLLKPARPGADWRLRSFTAAGAEVFGAGHNSLGAWWLLAELGRLALAEGDTVFHQEIGDSVLPLAVSSHQGRPAHIVMDQDVPVAGRTLEDLGALAGALGLGPGDLAAAGLPCQVVSTGAPHLLVPIRDRDTVDRIQPNAPALLEVLKGLGAEGCYVFSLDSRHPGASVYSRFFNPTVGIWEDPATGTAAGPLASHLATHGLIPLGRPIVIEQGTAMGRTSLIRAEPHRHTVRISGSGVTVASGQLRF
jgi:trans-2,3-dihydro-3-hydroxyanthranilate isomerase